MKAAVLQGSERTSLVEAPTPEPGPDDVLLRIEGCGICASSLPVWEGREWFDYPQAPGSPGHEPWGRVVGMGDRVTGIEPGTRVTGLSYRAYAEYDTAPAAAVVALPERFDDRPFPGEAFACAMNVFRRAGIWRGQRVAVAGSGFIGGLVIQCAVAAGAAVTAFSPREWSRARALEQGAEAACPPGEAGADAHRDAFDRVVECTGTQEGLDTASTLVAIGGRLVLAGYHQDGERRIDLQAWNWKGIDVINAHERDPRRYICGIHAAIEAILRGHVDPWPLLTHEVALDELDRGFALMQSRPDNFTKAILCL